MTDMFEAGSRSLKLSKVSGGARQMVNGAASSRSRARSTGLIEDCLQAIVAPVRMQAASKHATRRWRQSGIRGHTRFESRRPGILMTETIFTRYGDRFPPGAKAG